MNSELIKTSKLKNNTGQVQGLPKNPRFIKGERYKALIKSIKDDPEMLELREVIAYDNGGELVIIAGNMRLRACKELGIKEVPTKILPTNTPSEKLRAYTIKDNVGFGQDDMDLLANEWDSLELEGFGRDVPSFDNIDYSEKNKEFDSEDFEGQSYTFKLEYSELEYNEIKEALGKIGKTPEAIFYEALVSV